VGQSAPKSGAHRATKAERRAERENELAAKQIALPATRYGVIVADPEWRFEPYSRETGMDRAADNHYPTSVTDVIAARDVASIAADDCVLFLWATVPMLRDALRVMEAWGFDYKSHVVWDKVHIGTGYWFRNRHELLLVGTRGGIPAPAMGEQFASVMTIARKEHSAKPDPFLEMIEQYFPTLPKIELNRRGLPRPGWDAWGDETEQAA
jgi:N6-adenosine-specific RNA methylase IME4